MSQICTYFIQTKGIHKYESPEEILTDFVKIRSETYKKRKAHLIRVLKEKAKKLGKYVESLLIWLFMKN